jgi:hypothetical protein
MLREGCFEASACRHLDFHLLGGSLEGRHLRTEQHLSALALNKARVPEVCEEIVDTCPQHNVGDGQQTVKSFSTERRNVILLAGNQRSTDEPNRRKRTKPKTPTIVEAAT